MSWAGWLGLALGVVGVAFVGLALLVAFSPRGEDQW